MQTVLIISFISFRCVFANSLLIVNMDPAVYSRTNVADCVSFLGETIPASVENSASSVQTTTTSAGASTTTSSSGPSSSIQASSPSQTKTSRMTSTSVRQFFEDDRRLKSRADFCKLMSLESVETSTLKWHIMPFIYMYAFFCAIIFGCFVYVLKRFAFVAQGTLLLDVC